MGLINHDSPIASIARTLPKPYHRRGWSPNQFGQKQSTSHFRTGSPYLLRSTLYVPCLYDPWLATGTVVLVLPYRIASHISFSSDDTVIASHHHHQRSIPLEFVALSLSSSRSVVAVCPTTFIPTCHRPLFIGLSFVVFRVLGLICPCFAAV
jgi:hypothetical protein